MRNLILTLALPVMVAVSVGPGLARAARAASSTSSTARHDEVARAKPAAAAGARFGLELFARLRRTPGNAFFSPLSIEMALAMAAEGAGGATARQMHSVLHLPEDAPLDFGALSRQLRPADSTYDLVIANALWGDRGTSFEPAYLGRLTSRYGAELHQVDFADPAQASRTINDWVSRQSRAHIQELIAPGAIRARTRLVLTNAVYFKGRWADRFDEAMTSRQDFTPSPGAKLSIPFMERTGRYLYAEDPRAQVLALPYAGSGLSMLVVLPRRPDDLGEVETGFTLGRLNQWLARLGPRLVEVHLPRFRLETQYALEEILPRLGMTDAFEPGRADFSGMNGRRDLFIGLVAHKAFVEVNESGTTATAATGVMAPTALIRPASEAAVVFRADHPFLVLIRDSRTGAVLFLGRVARPGA